MAKGIPFIPGKVLGKVKKNHKTFKSALFLYKRYLYAYIKIKTFIKYDLYNNASLKPYKILEISPEEIKYKCRLSNERFEPKILDGDWDLQKTSFENSIRFKSIKNRFKNDKSWEKTELFEEIKDSIRGRSDFHDYNCESVEEIGSQLEEIDDLFYKIKNEGYVRQDNLSKTINPTGNDKIDYYLGSLSEVTVNIDRNGEFLLQDGKHRVSVAKILNLDTIPVRVLVRHQEWQEKRNIAVEDFETLNKEYQNHPDIAYLEDE